MASALKKGGLSSAETPEPKHEGDRQIRMQASAAILKYPKGDTSKGLYTKIQILISKTGCSSKII